VQCDDCIGRDDARVSLVKTSEVKRELDALSANIKQQFADVDERFSQVDARFAQVDARFAQVDARFAQVDARFAEVDARFDQVDARFDQVEQRILDEGERTRRHFDIVAESLRTEMRQGFAAISAMNERLNTHEATHVTVTHILDDHELRLKALERDRGAR
jgi:septal ring factor EnvC (AmiA/AmiB activator)